MITICKAQKKLKVSEAELRSIKEYLEAHQHIFIDYAMETHGMYRQLHMHAIIKKPPHYWVYGFAGFRIYYSIIYDLRGAQLYIYKHAYNFYSQQQILDINEYNYQSRFIPLEPFSLTHFFPITH